MANDLLLFPVQGRGLSAEMLPRPQPPEVLEKDMRAFSGLHNRLRSWLTKVAHTYSPLIDMSDAVEARRFLAEDLKTLSVRTKSAARPATVAEIARYLGILTGTMSGGKVDMEIYAQALHEDVCALQPRIGPVELGCRQIRRTSTWVPDISAVLAAIGAAENFYSAILDAVAAFPDSVARIEPTLEAAAQRRREVEAEERCDLKRAIRRALERGEDFPKWRGALDPALIEEVRLEMSETNDVLEGVARPGSGEL